GPAPDDRGYAGRARPHERAPGFRRQAAGRAEAGRHREAEPMKLLNATILPALALGAGLAAAMPDWGARGHEAAARAAVTNLPAGLPAFFRASTDQLVYLNPEPDRWRDGASAAMDEAWKYDHYIDFEVIPPAALQAPDRFSFLQEIQRTTSLERP